MVPVCFFVCPILVQCIVCLLIIIYSNPGNQRDLNLVLLQAVKAGYLESTEVMIDAGASANTQDAYDNTPLLLASEMGNFKMVIL